MLITSISGTAGLIIMSCYSENSEYGVLLAGRVFIAIS